MSANGCGPCGMATLMPPADVQAHFEELPLRGQILGANFWPDPSQPWEHLHTNIRPGYWVVPLVNIKWGSMGFDVPAPADQLVTDDSIALLWDQVFSHFGAGSLLMVALFSRADRVAGIPFLWHYHCVVIYQDVPSAHLYAAAALPAFATLVEFFALILALVITIRILGTGDIKDIVEAPFQGIAGVFILGIVLLGVVGFVFPQLQARSTARLGPVGVEAGAAPRSRARR